MKCSKKVESLFENPDAVTDDYYLRCPFCSCKMEAWECNYIYKDGDHEVFCDECDKVFVINTMVRIEFKSPALSDGRPNEC